MDRLFIQGLVTTFIGLGIIVFCGVLIYQGKSTAMDLAGWLSTGLLFLRSKDSLIGIPKND